MSDEEMNEAFDGLNKKFNTNFESEKEGEELIESAEELQKNLEDFQKKKNQLTGPSDDLILSDQEYLRNELKALISNTKVIMRKLENDIKIGTHPRAHEVYAKMVNSVNETLKELKDLNSTIAELKIKNVKMENNSKNKISLTSNQLLDMLDKAKESSQMKEIDADFTITDEDMK